MGSREDSITDQPNPTLPGAARILVVEDFAPHRALISSFLSQREDLKMIGEVSNGLEAVRKAEELQPDIILLDIGLPELNGMDAARQIRKLAPHSRIIFVTQERSPEIVEEAMRLGAYGYVFKSDIQSELLRAVDSALEGKRFFRGGNGQPGTRRGDAP